MSYNQKLFDYLHDLGITATQSDMEEIRRLVLEQIGEDMASYGGIKIISEPTYEGFKEWIESMGNFESNPTLHAMRIYEESMKPEPIFTNSLGQEFFEGDVAWYCHKKCFSFDSYVIVNKNNHGETDTTTEIFKTESDCLKWIEGNKPQYSRKQIEKALPFIDHKVFFEQIEK